MRDHVVLRLVGPGRAICARRLGLMQRALVFGEISLLRGFLVSCSPQGPSRADPTCTPKRLRAGSARQLSWARMRSLNGRDSATSRRCEPASRHFTRGGLPHESCGTACMGARLPLTLVTLEERLCGDVGGCACVCASILSSALVSGLTPTSTPMHRSMRRPLPPSQAMLWIVHVV